MVQPFEKFRTPYEEYDASLYATQTVGESMTKQSFADECDLNKIIAKFRKAGLVDQLHQEPERFADVSGMTDYHEALNVVASTRELFAELPADLRLRFVNDAGVFVKFAADTENDDEMRELGLLPPKRPPEGPEGGAGEPSQGTGSPTPAGGTGGEQAPAGDSEPANEPA